MATLTFRQSAMVSGTTMQVDMLDDRTMRIQLSTVNSGATIIIPNEELIIATIRMMEEGYRFMERNKPK